MEGQHQEASCKNLKIDLKPDLSSGDELEIEETTEPLGGSCFFISRDQFSTDLPMSFLKPMPIEKVPIQNEMLSISEHSQTISTKRSAICSPRSSSMDPDDSANSCLKTTSLISLNLKFFSEIDRVSFYLHNGDYRESTPIIGFECSLNALLVKLILRERFFQETMRKEQIYKRVLNICLKAILSDFKKCFYPGTRVPKKTVKAEMIRHYFGAESIFLSKGKLSKNLSADIPVSNFAYVNFNKKAMAALSASETFRTDLLEKIEFLTVGSEAESDKQLFKFLRACDEWIVSRADTCTPEYALLSFFDHKNRAGKKRGVNIPWSTNQIKHACQMTALALKSPYA